MSSTSILMLISSPHPFLSLRAPPGEANYRAYCKQHGVPAHPARMQKGLVSFFIDFLTNPTDLVLDPFGGV